MDPISGLLRCPKTRLAERNRDTESLKDEKLKEEGRGRGEEALLKKWACPDAPFPERFSLIKNSDYEHLGCRCTRLVLRKPSWIKSACSAKPGV